MKVAKLRNGSVEQAMLVRGTMSSLMRLFSEDPLAFYELVQKCRNKNHAIFSPVQVKTLEDSGLLTNNSVHNSIQNIVLSSVEGEGLDMKLVSPVLVEVEE